MYQIPLMAYAIIIKNIIFLNFNKIYLFEVFT